MTGSDPNQLLLSAAAAVFQDPAYGPDDWRHLAVVYDFVDGSESQYGYVFRADGSWSARIPKDSEDAILDSMLALKQAMADQTGKAWHKALLHIDTDARMNIQFEYDDPARWTIRPSDLEASVEALRPAVDSSSPAR